MRAEDQILRRVTLRELRVLAAAVRCGSVAKAARELGLTQPAVSKAIASLESTLGAQLVERSALGVEPTAAGRLLLARSTNIFDELKQAARELEILAHPLGGELNVGASAALSAGLLPAILTEMQKRRPAIRHFAVEAEQSILFRELRARAIDLALARERGEDSEIHFEKLFDERLLVVVPVAHPLARRRSVKLSDLLQARWILPSPDSFVGRMVRDAFEQHGLALPSGSVTTMSVLARFELLASGDFVTTLPESLLRFSHTHPPVAILPMDPFLIAPVGVARLKRSSVSPVARLFVECAQELTSKLQPLDARALSRLARKRDALNPRVCSSRPA
jgi:molybdate transport repressor ModE-like protein